MSAPPIRSRVVGATAVLAAALVVVAGAAPPPSPPPREGEGVTGEWVASGGLRRTYALHVPPSYDPARPAPLVVAFHGAHGSRAFAQRVGLEAAADRHGYVVASPDGTSGTWALGCHCTAPDRERVDDVRFFRTLVAQIAKGFAIDKRRVYAAGFSDGGTFTYRLACERAGDLAAIAVVAGTLTCEPTRALPVLAIHGTEDPIIPFPQGLAAVGAWAARAGCDPSGHPGPMGSRGSDGTSVTRIEFPACAAEVRMLRVEGGGHSWPGSPWKYPAWTGRQSAQVDAGEEILAFFDRHR